MAMAQVHATLALAAAVAEENRYPVHIVDTGKPTDADAVRRAVRRLMRS